MANIGPVFVLAFPPRDGCTFCFASLDEGDEAAYVDDELACIQCRDEQVNEEECLLDKQIENMKRRRQNGK